MTIQEACDDLTILCHKGLAQATLKHVSGEIVKDVGGIEMIGDDVALLVSEEMDE